MIKRRSDTFEQIFNLNKMEINIRKVGLEDLDATAELFNRYRVFYRQQDDYEKCKKFIQDRMENDQSHIFVVYADGTRSEERRVGKECGSRGSTSMGVKT